MEYYITGLITIAVLSLVVFIIKRRKRKPVEEDERMIEELYPNMSHNEIWELLDEKDYSEMTGAELNFMLSMAYYHDSITARRLAKTEDRVEIDELKELIIKLEETTLKRGNRLQGNDFHVIQSLHNIHHYLQSDVNYDVSGQIEMIRLEIDGCSDEVKTLIAPMLTNKL